MFAKASKLPVHFAAIPAPHLDADLCPRHLLLQLLRCLMATLVAAADANHLQIAVAVYKL
jgi:hypothetical protein